MNLVQLFFHLQVPLHLLHLWMAQVVFRLRKLL
ncbi:hypothetical protein CIY_11390 [Butyrivibrio fibrisolvens 16/4]|nr:hypothetical protein CIY_11390 [Butyrivibrio fibrisolvens 16/4]